MRPRWQKVFADLWGNKTRSFLVVASIAVGLYAVGIIASVNEILVEDMRNGYRAVNPANLNISIPGFSDALIEKIRDLPYVGKVEARKHMVLRYKNKYGEWDRLESRLFPRLMKCPSTWSSLWKENGRQITVRSLLTPVIGKM